MWLWSSLLTSQCLSGLMCKTGIKKKKFTLCPFVRIHVKQLGQCLAHSRYYVSASKTKPTHENSKLDLIKLWTERTASYYYEHLWKVLTWPLFIYTKAISLQSWKGNLSCATALLSFLPHATFPSPFYAFPLGSYFSSSIPAINRSWSCGKQLEFYNTRQSFTK